MLKVSFITEPPENFGPFGQYERALATLSTMGYQGVEFSLTSPYGFDAASMSRACLDTGLRVSGLLTGWSYFNEGLALCAPDAAVRTRAVARLTGHLDLAARLDTLLIIGQMQGFRTDEPNPEIANERIADCLAAVAEAARAQGVTVVLEPVNHLQAGFNNTVAEVMAMVQRVASPALRPMVDTLHMNIEECTLTEPILQAGRDLAHAHLCESNGGVFGTGHINFAAVLSALAAVEYDGFVTVKVYRGATWEDGAATALEILNRAVAAADSTGPGAGHSNPGCVRRVDQISQNAGMQADG
jgi:D-psicose/D-tagatose/L-ribulose 3-epimerase